MVAYFHVLQKRKNSTRVPEGLGTELEVVLKDDCQVLTPALDVRGLGAPPTYNYFYIPDFNRYYFVQNWSYYHGLWTVTGTVDVLASWVQNIRATRAFVLASASSYNLMAVDDRIGATAGYVRNRIDYDMAGTLAGQESLPGGYFAVTALSKESNWATGIPTTYFMTWTQMQTFARALLDMGFWEQLKQFFENPMDGIIDCYYIPVNVTMYGQLSNDIPVQIGEYTLPGVMGKAPTATALAVRSKSQVFEIPWVYNDFRRCSKFTSLDLFMPFCGSKSIKPEDILGTVDENGQVVDETMTMDYGIDIMTGAVQGILYSTEKKAVLEEFSGNLKIQLPIGQTQSRVGQVIGTVAATTSVLTGLAMGNLAMASGGIWAAVSNVIQPATHKTMGGFNGSILGATVGNGGAGTWQNFRLTCTARNSTTDPSNIRASNGNVLGRSVTLSAISGFVQTSQASVSISGYDEERDQINSLLDSGIFLE